MTTWIIGDLQGCHESLQSLLADIGFNSARDELIFVGDLVNRGPDSEGCLRHVQRLCEAGSARTVLGNHDLHLLAVAAGLRKPNRDDTLDAILAAPDRRALLDWLARQPLMLHLDDDAVTHAGLHPDWDMRTASDCAAELQTELSRPDRERFLARMYGNEPARWAACRDDEGRQRFAVNVFTRMRFLRTADHALTLKAKGSAEQPPEGCLPWFMLPHQRPAHSRVFFGHWSTLGTVAWPTYGVYGLDTGCLWNGRLTACDPESGTLRSVPTAPGEGRSPS
ncbi:symmetrical bis(5'-nucleosyl)-tetraphosphatase [Algiphilus aromaticivorans]|jgi:bis(5'-nucleosyl)-tetraphosphatase (symmetrical)|uniref:symmetrical bis(5'-nucleosyl)-tetraphosphatase n=1 Tax=Algiphilus aromaticivorans TaxID=382454 RepID=UPI0005C13254|nr:symmetrical bis(5'-nucleosyl)-tetraphosphatase [Algiphilus aromaticivorans]